MKVSNRDKILYFIVFVLSLILYLNAFSLFLYVFLVVATLALFYYALKVIKGYRFAGTSQKIASVIEVLFFAFLILIFISMVHYFPNLCINSPETFGKSIFSGEVKIFCGTEPWYFERLEGQETKDAGLKLCNEYVANDPFYQKRQSGNTSFDDLSGNFIEGDTYLRETPENTFGVIKGINYGFDFSAGQRTTDLANADIVLENGKVKSLSGSEIYEKNSWLSTNRGPLQEFHLRDTVFDVQPIGEISLDSFDFAFIKTREGNFAKVRVSMYGVDNRGNTVITIFWAYQPNGTKSLKSDFTNFAKELDTYCRQYQ